MLDVVNLENRPFEWGRADCYELVRDLYREQFGIELRNYARPVNWKADTMNLILVAYQREGLVRIGNWKLEDIRPGDIMAMAIGESNANHLAVYIGDNKFIHHLYGNFSRISPLAGHWIHSTCFLLRHPDVPDLRPQLKETPIQEILRARYQVRPDEAA